MAKIEKHGNGWSYRYTDANRVRRRGGTYSDKRVAAQALAADLELVDRLKAGFIDDRELALRDHAAMSLADHIEAYRAHLKAKGNKPQHIALTVNRIRRLAAVVKGAAFSEVNPPKATRKADKERFKAALDDRLKSARLGDLTAAKVQSALRSLVDDRAGLTSVNHYATAIRMFSKWCWDSGRAKDHALRTVKGFNAATDRRHPRRALTVKESNKLIQTATAGPVAYGMTGADRAVLYALALGTGFRANELASLTTESFRLESSSPTVHLAAESAKNVREANQPISRSLAEVLRPWLASRVPGRPVFAWTKGRTAAMLRVDLEAAGIAYQTPEGKADFHSLRATYITNLIQSGVSIKLVQILARHASPILTMTRYAKVRIHDEAEAVESLPDLMPQFAEPDASIPMATGAEGTTEPAPTSIGPEGCTDVQRISNRRGPLLVHSGDVSRRKESSAGVMASSIANEREGRLEAKNTGFSASGREWAEGESNSRHTDFQSVALPTELSARVCGRGENREFGGRCQRGRKKTFQVKGRSRVVWWRRICLARVDALLVCLVALEPSAAFGPAGRIAAGIQRSGPRARLAAGTKMGRRGSSGLTPARVRVN